MDFFKILENEILLVPACAWGIAQLLKAIINLIVNKRFSIERLFGDGGMPSGHSATVTSLAVMVGLSDCGFDSAEFAIATILAIIVMHDATGVRREAGKQAVSIIKITELLNEYFSESDEHIKIDKLKVLVGHTPLQVVCGAVLGASVAILYNLLSTGFVFI
jgi:acid phosphatase family membrane protein YuiD